MGNCSFSSFGNRDRILVETDVVSFNPEELNACMDAFNGRKFIGRGSFGRVYRGIIRGNGQQVAVKISRNKDQRTRTQWQAEIEYMPRLQHPNIMELVGYRENLERFCLVYPFMQNGTVLSKLPGLKWRRTLKIIKGTANAIQKLHGAEPPLIHGDLKLNNVLLDKDFTPKLADFGRVTPEGEHFKSGTRADDIYSLGVMILQLIMKEKSASLDGVTLPWHISDWATRIHAEKGHAVHLALTTTGCSKSAAVVISGLGLDCVKAEPSERPLIDEVVLRLAYL